MVAGAEYEMACGHCRRPRKEILAFNFDQLCWIRGLSSSPKSQGGSKVVLRGPKMAPEIGSLEPQNSPSRPEAHPGRALALPAPRKAPGRVRAAADCTPPGGHPGAATPGSGPQPSPPQLALATLLTTTCSYWYLLFPRPHTPLGVGGFPGQRPHAPTLEKNVHINRICRQSGACFVRLCVLSHRMCSAVPTTRFEIQHATVMVAQRAPRADFGAPKAPREPISEIRKLPETLPDSSRMHPSAPLRAWNLAN